MEQTNQHIMRMFLSVPGHATFAVLMGYFTGLAKFSKGSRLPYFFLALLLPVLFHGAFDFFVFAGRGGPIFIGALVSFIVALVLSFKAIRRKQAISKLYFEELNAQFPPEQKMYDESSN